MARGKSADDLTTIQMALVGYEIEKKRIEEKIRELQAQLKGRRGSANLPSNSQPESGGGRRNLSPAARRRIAAAQRKRWAEHRKRQAQSAKGKAS